MMGLRDPDARRRRPISRLTVLRWMAAAAAVIVAQGAGAWIAINWRPSVSDPSEPPPAVMIDLAPIAVALPAPPQQVAPGPQQTQAEPEPTPDTPNPVEDAPPDPTPPNPPQVVQNAKPDPTPAPQPDVKLPDLPKKDKAEAVLAPPPPQKQKVHKKHPPRRREIERRKPVRRDKKRIRRTTAPPTSEARRSDVAAAPSAGASFAPSMSPATWKGELMAHLNRYKRYPPGATSFGDRLRRFLHQPIAQVLSSRLIRSSGDRALDEEAVSLPRRASPVPPPPPDIGGGVITLTVPVHFGS